MSVRGVRLPCVAMGFHLEEGRHPKYAWVGRETGPADLRATIRFRENKKSSSEELDELLWY
jgi:uncharacterized protein (DUF2249 family)